MTVKNDGAQVDMRMFAKRAGTNQRFVAGSTIFSRGDGGDCMYIMGAMARRIRGMGQTM